MVPGFWLTVPLGTELAVLLEVDELNEGLKLDEDEGLVEEVEVEVEVLVVLVLVGVGGGVQTLEVVVGGGGGGGGGGGRPGCPRARPGPWL